MKDTLNCGKCGSRHVIEVKGSKMQQTSSIPLTKWSMKTAILDRYICSQCGYTEEYVQLTAGFKKWAQKELQKNEDRYDDYV